MLFSFHTQKISKGGFVKRAVPEDRPPPPSYSRRQPEERTAKASTSAPPPQQQEQGPSSLPASRQGSGALSRGGSASLSTRSGSLPRTASGIQYQTWHSKEQFSYSEGLRLFNSAASRHTGSKSDMGLILGVGC